jgi:alanyl-tRNA synthetase
LNTKEPFINQLVAVLADQMGEFFPEIKKTTNFVTNDWEEASLEH